MPDLLNSDDTLCTFEILQQNNKILFTILLKKKVTIFLPNS